MKTAFLLSASLLFSPIALLATEPTTPVENEISFTVDFVTFKEAKPKFRPVHQEQPVYPAELLNKRVEGFAVVAFLVDLDGKTAQCQVAAATNAAFGEAARAAIEHWRFTPPQFGGKPGLIAMQLPIEFKLVNSNAPSSAPLEGDNVALRSSPAGSSATTASAAAQAGS
jgi:protein TonB